MEGQITRKKVTGTVESSLLRSTQYSFPRRFHLRAEVKRFAQREPGEACALDGALENPEALRALYRTLALRGGSQPPHLSRQARIAAAVSAGAVVEQKVLQALERRGKKNRRAIEQKIQALEQQGKKNRKESGSAGDETPGPISQSLSDEEAAMMAMFSPAMFPWDPVM